MPKMRAEGEDSEIICQNIEYSCCGLLYHNHFAHDLVCVFGFCQRVRRNRSGLLYRIRSKQMVEYILERLYIVI